MLRALVGDDAQTIDELLADYADSAREMATGIGEAFVAGNLGRVAVNAHRLKASSRAVGALALGDLCAELEVASRAGAADAVGTWIGRFADERARVEACLHAVLPMQRST